MNFLLGVGAQRCGTTWLANYLQQHPQVFMSPYKELHVFDTMFAPQESGYTPERRFRDLGRLLNNVVQGARLSEIKLEREVERYSLGLSDQAYRAYFRKNMRPGHRSVGEITPSYSLIPAGGFRHIRSLLVDVGFNPRVIFIMRDPVERLFSQVRFNQGTYASALSSPGMLLRSRYDLTVSNLRGQFEPDELLLLFYEDLFTKTSIEVICRFLDIDVRAADFSKRLNDTADGEPIDPGIWTAAREQLDVVYEFCADQFGRETIRNLWQSY